MAVTRPPTGTRSRPPTLEKWALVAERIGRIDHVIKTSQVVASWHVTGFDQHNDSVVVCFLRSIQRMQARTTCIAHSAITKMLMT